jgi:hypothetical protein
MRRSIKKMLKIKNKKQKNLDGREILELYQLPTIYVYIDRNKCCAYKSLGPGRLC